MCYDYQTFIFSSGEEELSIKPPQAHIKKDRHKRRHHRDDRRRDRDRERDRFKGGLKSSFRMVQ